MSGKVASVLEALSSDTEEDPSADSDPETVAASELSVATVSTVAVSDAVPQATTLRPRRPANKAEISLFFIILLL